MVTKGHYVNNAMRVRWAMPRKVMKPARRYAEALGHYPLPNHFQQRVIRYIKKPHQKPEPHHPPE
jgi:hypothetical protein